MEVTGMGMEAILKAMDMQGNVLVKGTHLKKPEKEPDRTLP